MLFVLNIFNPRMKNNSNRGVMLGLISLNDVILFSPCLTGS